MKTDGDVLEKARKLYEKPVERKLAANAGIVEATGYLQWPRLKDTIEFDKLMGYKKLGIAFCIGLQKEASILSKILEKYGFEVFLSCARREVYQNLKSECLKNISGHPKRATPSVTLHATPSAKPCY